MSDKRFLPSQHQSDQMYQLSILAMHIGLSGNDAKKLLSGLTEVEQAKLDHINQSLDDLESDWYDPIVAKLKKLKEIARRDERRVKCECRRYFGISVNQK